MRCDTAQRALSAAMDDAGTPGADVQAHRRTCPACSRFEASAWRLREAARFEVASPVPDLTTAIMERVRLEAADQLLGWAPVPRQLRAAGPAWLFRYRAAAVAMVVGVILGLVLTAGGLVLIGGRSPAARAEEIPAELRAAASQLKGYRATFDIVEHHWTRDVPRRTFRADVAFRAPESFRVQVRDTTSYPSDAWPRNDLLLQTDGRTWRATGPDPCPAAALPACPRATPVDRSLTDRPPFDPRTPMPTDVIVPMTVLAASDRVDLIGSDRVAGRDAVAVELSYQDAAPLFGFLRFLGSWRTFFPEDRVGLWLDRETWFPLKYEVFPAGSPERDAWASQLGFPAEPPSAPVFEATARTLSTGVPDARLFGLTQGAGAVDERFNDVPLAPDGSGKGLVTPGGGRLAVPARTEGLRLWRYGRFDRTSVRPYQQSVLSYARGLSWLTVTRIAGWSQAALFGVGPFAEPVRFAGGGTGYYEPASDTQPRRVALHTDKVEILVASNLPRAQLLAIAGSLPDEGLPQPDGWRVHRGVGRVVEDGLTPAQAEAKVSFAPLAPRNLPAGYRAVSAEFVHGSGSNGLTIVYRRPAAEFGGIGLRLYQAAGQDLPPPTGADQLTMPLRATMARWSPQDHLLEWVEGHVYRSLTGPSLDLATMLGVARSLVPVPGSR